MPRACSVCQHPKRAEIEAAILSGASYRVIARQQNVGHDSLKRHVDGGHIQASVAAEQVAKDAKRGLDVEKQLLTINAAMFKILKDSMTDKKMYHMADKAANTILKQLDFAHRIGKADELEERLAALEQARDADDD